MAMQNECERCRRTGDWPCYSFHFGEFWWKYAFRDDAHNLIIAKRFYKIMGRKSVPLCRKCSEHYLRVYYILPFVVSLAYLASHCVIVLSYYFLDYPDPDWWFRYPLFRYHRWIAQIIAFAPCIYVSANCYFTYRIRSRIYWRSEIKELNDNFPFFIFFAVISIFCSLVWAEDPNNIFIPVVFGAEVTSFLSYAILLVRARSRKEHLLEHVAWRIKRREISAHWRHLLYWSTIDFAELSQDVPR